MCPKSKYSSPWLSGVELGDAHRQNTEFDSTFVNIVFGINPL